MMMMMVMMKRLLNFPQKKQHVLTPKTLSTLGCHPLSKKDSWKHLEAKVIGRGSFFCFKWLIFSGLQQLGFYGVCIKSVPKKDWGRRGSLEIKKCCFLQRIPKSGRFLSTKMFILVKRFQKNGWSTHLGEKQNMFNVPPNNCFPFSKLSEVNKKCLLKPSKSFFQSPGWRSLHLKKGHVFTIPKRSQSQNCQGGLFFCWNPTIESSKSENWGMALSKKTSYDQRRHFLWTNLFWGLAWKVKWFSRIRISLVSFPVACKKTAHYPRWNGKKWLQFLLTPIASEREAKVVITTGQKRGGKRFTTYQQKTYFLKPFLCHKNIRPVSPFQQNFSSPFQISKHLSKFSKHLCAFPTFQILKMHIFFFECFSLFSGEKNVFRWSS